MNAGFAIAEKCQSSVHIVHVLTRKKHRSYFAAEGVGVDHHIRLHREKLHRLVSPIFPGAKHEVLYAESIPEEILKYARAQECDLIVVGSHGHSAGAAMLLGSTSG